MLQLQLAPRRTSPLKLPASSGADEAAASAKNRGCTPWKSSGIARSIAAAAPRQHRPSTDISIQSMTRASGDRHDRAAAATGALFGRRPETLEYRRQLRLDVAHVEVLLVEQRIASLAVPEEAILFVRQPASLDDQPHRIGLALRGMRNVARKQQNFTLPNRQIDAAAVLDRTQQHVALELVEEFRAGVIVIVLARVWTPDDHDDELGVLEHLLVAHRRLQQVSVLVDPALEIKGDQRRHPGPTRRAGGPGWWQYKGASRGGRAVRWARAPGGDDEYQTAVRRVAGGRCSAGARAPAGARRRGGADLEGHTSCRRRHAGRRAGIHGRRGRQWPGRHGPGNLGHQGAGVYILLDDVDVLLRRPAKQGQVGPRAARSDGRIQGAHQVLLQHGWTGGPVRACRSGVLFRRGDHAAGGDRGRRPATCHVGPAGGAGCDGG